MKLPQSDKSHFVLNHVDGWVCVFCLLGVHIVPGCSILLLSQQKGDQYPTRIRSVTEAQTCLNKADFRLFVYLKNAILVSGTSDGLVKNVIILLRLLQYVGKDSPTSGQDEVTHLRCHL